MVANWRGIHRREKENQGVEVGIGIGDSFEFDVNGFFSLKKVDEASGKVEQKSD